MTNEINIPSESIEQLKEAFIDRLRALGRLNKKKINIDSEKLQINLNEIIVKGLVEYISEIVAGDNDFISENITKLLIDNTDIDYYEVVYAEHLAFKEPYPNKASGKARLVNEIAELIFTKGIERFSHRKYYTDLLYYEYNYWDSQKGEYRDCWTEFYIAYYPNGNKHDAIPMIKTTNDKRNNHGRGQGRDLIKLKKEQLERIKAQLEENVIPSAINGHFESAITPQSLFPRAVCFSRFPSPMRVYVTNELSEEDRKNFIDKILASWGYEYNGEGKHNGELHKHCYSYTLIRKYEEIEQQIRDRINEHFWDKYEDYTVIEEGETEEDHYYFNEGLDVFCWSFNQKELIVGVIKREFGRIYGLDSEGFGERRDELVFIEFMEQLGYTLIEKKIPRHEKYSESYALYKFKKP